MSWYKTGSISITNGLAVVTGSGTLWVDNGTLNSCDLILMPDGKEYEILSIQSNTGLTLASNYLGTTVSGASYAIVPIGLLPSALAQQVKSTLAVANTALSSGVLSNTNAQGLTTTQQQNARTNIAALGVADLDQSGLYKADSVSPIFVKTGASTLSIKAASSVVVAGTKTSFAAQTAVVMPTLTAGSATSRVTRGPSQ